MTPARAAAAALLLAAGPARAAPADPAEPRLQDVLSAVTLAFGEGGGFDRAVLTQGEEGADLAIYRDVPAPGRDAAMLRPAFAKADVAWSGQSWGTLASLSVNGRGALVITSENDAIGRNRWHMALTVVSRGGRYLVVGITRDERDTLDPTLAAACDLNLSTGKGTVGGRPVTMPPGPVPLADWSDGRIPKGCGG